jgi:hypothetical protein
VKLKEDDTVKRASGGAGSPSKSSGANTLKTLRAKSSARSRTGLVSRIYRFSFFGGITCKVIRELEAEDVCHVDESLDFQAIDLGSSDMS